MCAVSDTWLDFCWNYKLRAGEWRIGILNEKPLQAKGRLILLLKHLSMRNLLSGKAREARIVEYLISHELGEKNIA